jgi:SnoaL-like domain
MSDAAEEALAHAHITSLLARYYHSIDSGDWATLRERVLDEAAVWEVAQSSTQGSVTQVVEGRTAILEWFATIVGGEVSMSESTVRHFVNTTDITVTGATATSTSHLMCVHNATLAVLANGRIVADHVVTPDGWRIRRFRLNENITDADMDAFRAAFDLPFDA